MFLGPFHCTCVRATCLSWSILTIVVNDSYYLCQSMPHSFLLFLLFVVPALAGAQSGLVTQLANEVCHCMETYDSAISPAELASECVRIVGQRHKKELLEKLSLNPDKPQELGLISERLADHLSRNCPLLTTLRLDEPEREFRWSDRNADRKAEVVVPRYKFPKKPSADLPEQTVSEPPAEWRVKGNIVGRPGRGSLRLRLTNDEIKTFEFPAALSRRVELTDGQAVTVFYDRQWRKVESGGIVALVVRSIE